MFFQAQLILQIFPLRQINQVIKLKTLHYEVIVGLLSLILNDVSVHCQQMQQSELIKTEKDDSDNDEGFIVNTVQIKQKQVFKASTHLNTRPTDFLARYISANYLLKKQLPELINSYPHFPREDAPNVQFLPRKKQKDLLMTVDERYFNNKNYRLVYQRSAKKVDHQGGYTQHDISLASILNYSSDNYSLLKNWEIHKENEDITFQSRFESGNLAFALKSLTEEHNYILFLQNDTNSKGYNKWFYFAVKNSRKNITYTFSIVNLRKTMAFFRNGMKLTQFSQKQHNVEGNGWSRAGKNIQMYRSQICTKDNPQTNLFYTLSFDITFPYENDLTFISLLPPYSYSKLINFLHESKLSSELRDNFNFDLSTIGYSLSNTQVPYVTISSNDNCKKNILVLARQHPGQVWSSFLAQSIIRELMRDSNSDRDWILKNYKFRIFPMINIDGVIYGNFRCDLSGMDLNRNWKSPNKLIHPHLISIQQQIRRLSTQQQIVCCLDLHAHSKDYNIFAYCCKTDNEGRVLPFILSRMTPLFHFPSCTFGISKYKQTTARATIYEMAKTNDVLTIQASFFGFNNPLKGMSPSIFLNFAAALFKTLKIYYTKSKQYLQAEQALPKALAEIAQLRKNKDKLFNSQSGSDSQPECDVIQLKQKIGNILPKCQVVDQAFGLSKQQKNQVDSKPKQQIQVKKPKKQKNKNQSRVLQKISLQTDSALSRPRQIPQLSAEKSYSNKNNRSLLEKVLKGSISRQQKKKQVGTAEGSQQVLHIRQRKNDSLELPPARKSIMKSLNVTGFDFLDSQSRRSRYQMHYKYEKREQQQFPLLCVLSERKKQAHLQKLKRIHPAPNQRQKPIVRYQPTLVINKKLDTMDRLRQRQKNSSDLVSSIWRETINLDNQYPIRSIFYGGL